jgi:hypothetical protein
MDRGTFFLDHLNFKDRYKRSVGWYLTVIMVYIVFIAIIKRTANLKRCRIGFQPVSELNSEASLKQTVALSFKAYADPSTRRHVSPAIRNTPAPW